VTVGVAASAAGSKPGATGRALVVGYGNRLRGDDGAGRAVADALAMEAIPGAEVIDCHQLTPELAICLAAVDLVVFVDAAAGVHSGRVVVASVQCAAARSAGFGHHLDPGTLLTMSKELYGRLPSAFLVTVGAGSFELGEYLSEAVASALPDAIASVRQLLREHLRPA
jgi:hydrogenase maturation protease